MAEKIILMQQPLSATLYAIRKGDLMPSNSKFVILEEFIFTMKPIVEITEAIGGEKWVTISTVRPLIYNLLEDYLRRKQLDSKLKKDKKTAMADNLAGRYIQSALMFLNVQHFLIPGLNCCHSLPMKKGSHILNTLKQKLLTIHLIQLKKKQRIHKKKQTHQRRNYDVKGSYCT